MDINNREATRNLVGIHYTAVLLLDGSFQNLERVFAASRRISYLLFHL